MTQNNGQEPWLIFVDTNILLDFYRLGKGLAKKHIDALESHKDSLIMCEQVWMEFLKNRQKVIIATLKEMKKPNKISVASIVADNTKSKQLLKNIDDAIKNYERVNKQVEKILNNPERNDPIYKAVKRIFKTNSEYNLKRPNKKRFAIRNLARKRFALGYPPRKSNDTSIGDSYNWEWIIECANTSPERHNILIVSRDGDYGISHNSNAKLNDWLKQEFKDRVSQRRKIELTTKLTDALKRLNEAVTSEDENEERRIIDNTKSFYFDISKNLPSSGLTDSYLELIKELKQITKHQS